MATRQWFESLEFDLPAALLRELTQLFDEMDQGALNGATVAKVPEAQGVYQLFLDGGLVTLARLMPKQA